MQCPHFDAGRCHSCTLLGTPYATQVSQKQRHVSRLLEGAGNAAAPSGSSPGSDAVRIDWSPPVTGPESGFRNKAKMVVSGTVDEPVLGILDEIGQGVDLTDCGLYPPALQATFSPLKGFIRRARLEPYLVSEPERARSGKRRRDTAGRGELKYVLVTISPEAELMVRFVMRSTEALARIRKHLPSLRSALPNLAVATVNVQPAHAAVLEGDREIVLTDSEALTMRVGGIPLALRPQSFFQTNTPVAARLYRQAREWVDDVGPASLWDLYCGVGGFALHCATPGRSITGIELSREAVAAATATANTLGLSDVRFEAGDARDVVGRLATDAPEMVIVNPPRRGIGAVLARALDRSTVGHVLYSSCNATTLAADLAHMPGLRPVRGVVLDMFPQTQHYEVLVLLRRERSARHRRGQVRAVR
ncbi:23S rRNA (uracil(747)-C(5))-methyltransferase RlmC [Myceligenerans salitolerans]|uniref:23S rRNA (Uracil(747)-C(5))-methyltransferase RlmC n=1 Tax=Myceligenerans salitolerans TaxID=1230528 RepID=A0ABS3ICQ1_9MICO|nr:23S rRNA (uracil(747)-C(5))-methyltransferase RlmC [Myceligenerans salitolerans]MBO0609827.1 23S rRNA (uracil(747)-C(5))-methyltransferase RlmC [Myceligenerans salitolerans]